MSGCAKSVCRRPSACLALDAYLTRSTTTSRLADRCVGVLILQSRAHTLRSRKRYPYCHLSTLLKCHASHATPTGSCASACLPDPDNRPYSSSSDPQIIVTARGLLPLLVALLCSSGSASLPPPSISSTPVPTSPTHPLPLRFTRLSSSGPTKRCTVR